MDVQTQWIESAPEQVRSFIQASWINQYVPVDNREWQVSYSSSGEGDMDVTGACVFGPMSDGFIYILSKTSDRFSLFAVTAAAAKTLSSSNVPVVTLDEDTSMALDILNVDFANVKPEEDNDEIDVQGWCRDDDRLHDAS